MPNFTEEARIIRELTRVGNGPDPFSSAVRATRMPMLITDPRKPDNPIVFANKAFARLTGYDRKKIIGENCRFLQGPATNKDDVARLREAVEKRETIELDLLNYKHDGTTFWNRLLVSPVFNEGDLTYFFASQLDVTLERERLARLQRDNDELEAEIARRTIQLQATEQRLRFALEAGRLGAWSIDLDSGRLHSSESCRAICGRSPNAPLSLKDLRASIHPDDLSVHMNGIEEAVATGGMLDIEYRIVTPEGETRWVCIRGQASYRADGTPMTMAGTTQDVTERHKLEEQRALLAGELGHRVKNILASVQSVASQTLRKAGSLEAAEATLRARLQAMSSAHDLLLNEEFGSVSLRILLERALAPFGIGDGSRFHLSGPDVCLPRHLVTAYALGMHELATNAAKYGALSNAQGVVDLHWQVLDGPPARMKLVWSERGGPPVTPPESAGFGTKLLQRLLTDQANGEAVIEYRPEGVFFCAVSSLDTEAQSAD